MPISHQGRGLSCAQICDVDSHLRTTLKGGYLDVRVLEQVPAVEAKDALADGCWVDGTAQERGIGVALHSDKNMLGGRHTMRHRAQCTSLICTAINTGKSTVTFTKEQLKYLQLICWPGPTFTVWSRFLPELKPSTAWRTVVGLTYPAAMEASAAPCTRHHPPF